MSAIEKVYNLVKKLNINDENEEKCRGILTDSIRKV